MSNLKDSPIKRLSGILQLEHLPYLMFYCFFILGLPRFFERIYFSREKKIFLPNILDGTNYFLFL